MCVLCVSGYLVLTGEAITNCPCLTQRVKGPGGTQVPTPSPVRHGTTSCGLLVLPQEDLPALTPSTDVDLDQASSRGTI